MKSSLISFQGRAGRKTWWLTVLAWTAVATVAQVIGIAGAFVSEAVGTLTTILGAVVAIVAAIAMLGVSVRRWHDVDKSGWWVLIALVPVVGIYALVMNGFVQGTAGDNRFGPEPTIDGLAAEASQPA